MGPVARQSTHFVTDFFLVDPRLMRVEIHRQPVFLNHTVHVFDVNTPWPLYIWQKLFPPNLRN